MNTFMNGLQEITNLKETENGALAYKSTLNGIYDMFAFGGAYRKRSESDIIVLLQKALDEDETLALKCLFYLRDIRGGQGERRFFRVAFRWLADNRPEVVIRNIENVAEYGRWDDLIYALEGTKCENVAFALIKSQLEKDIASDQAGCAVSLLAKWMPSENASSKETKRVASKIRQYFMLTSKAYRKTLSTLRKRLNIVERLMSQNRWDEIEFDKIPSRAGLIYRNAFARRDMIAKKYEKFVKDENTTVNAKDLYPYDLVAKALNGILLDYSYYRVHDEIKMSDVERAALQKMWDNQIDYFNGREESMLCVVDTSGSMYGHPINVAISLGLYCAERNKGDFANKYISFASRPQLIETRGVDFVDKVRRIYKTNLVDDTNLEAVFDLILKTALAFNTRPEDMPKKVLVISDMEINHGSVEGSTERVKTMMENMRVKYAAAGVKIPSLVYWNVDARQDTILDLGPDVSLVSGSSPVTFQMIMSGMTGMELMLNKLQSQRYAAIQ